MTIEQLEEKRRMIQTKYIVVDMNGDNLNQITIDDVEKLKITPHECYEALIDLLGDYVIDYDKREFEFNKIKISLMLSIFVLRENLNKDGCIIKPNDILKKYVLVTPFIIEVDGEFKEIKTNKEYVVDYNSFIHLLENHLIGNSLYTIRLNAKTFNELKYNIIIGEKNNFEITYTNLQKQLVKTINH